MRPVASEIYRVRVGLQITARPRFANKIETANDFGSGKESVRGGVLHIVRIGAVSGCISLRSARSAKFLVGVVNARVNYRDGHARTVEAGGLHGLCADVGNSFAQIEFVIQNRADRHDVRQGGNGRYARRVHLQDHCVQRLAEPRKLAPAHAIHGAHQVVLLL